MKDRMSIQSGCGSSIFPPISAHCAPTTTPPSARARTNADTPLTPWPTERSPNANDSCTPPSSRSRRSATMVRDTHCGGGRGSAGLFLVLEGAKPNKREEKNSLECAADGTPSLPHATERAIRPRHRRGFREHAKVSAVKARGALALARYPRFPPCVAPDQI